VADRPTHSRPPALLWSIRFGVLGGILIVAGMVAGSTPLTLAGTFAGVLSLVAVLIWRSQLISAWQDARVRGGDDLG
jgi:hypothetical protein